MLDYGEGPSPPRVGPFVLTFVFALAALLLARESCSEPRLGPPAGKPRPRDAARGPEPSFGSGDETSPGRAGEAPEVRRVGDVEARVAGAAWRVIETPSTFPGRTVRQNLVVVRVELRNRSKTDPFRPPAWQEAPASSAPKLTDSSGGYYGPPESAEQFEAAAGVKPANSPPAVPPGGSATLPLVFQLRNRRLPPHTMELRLPLGGDRAFLLRFPAPPEP
ncbi:MAG TPA: hypothetical protein VIL46_07435 [Gemmataceae bacterium]